VTAKVTNTGDAAGETVIQVYGRLRKSKLIRPDKRPLDWKRVRVNPGESQTIAFEITPDRLRMYDAQGAAVEAEGLCDIAVGENSAAAYTVQVEL